jgi:hypothetical protein
VTTAVSTVGSFAHRVTRLVFDAGQPYERFRGRYEAAVPPADPRLAPGLTRAGREPGPYGFVLYWRADMRPRMTAAGERRPCTAYLMGCPAVAEKIYRQDPAALLYSPLRALVYIDSDDRTRFAVDQPSTIFAGFADPAVAGLGAELDRRLAGLLRALGVEVTGLG